MKTVLVTGGAGQVGQAMLHRASTVPLNLVAPDRSALDLGVAGSIVDLLHSRPWDAVINLAAYTAVDKAEDEAELAFAINASAPELLARETAKLGCPMLHVSTDYVFSGALKRAYREDDEVGPINVYGASKLAGEQAIRAANPQHAIVRASWIVSAFRANFVKTMLRLASDRDVIRVVGDQFGSPTSANDLADALLAICLRLISGQDASFGTFHFCNAGAASWAEIAHEVMVISGEIGGPSAKIEPIGTLDYPTRARRPQNSRLDTTLIRTRYGIEAQTWQKAFQGIVRDCVTEKT